MQGRQRKDAAPTDKRPMRREEKKRRFKLWLLALALAIVLTWYIVNPTPGPLCRLRKEDDAQDGERSQTRVGGMSPQLGISPAILPAVAPLPAAANDDLPESPEYIEME